MRFITIGKQGVSLLLDCSALELGSVEVYKIPPGVSMPTGLEIACSLCYGILIFALPLIYRFTPEPVLCVRSTAFFGAFSAAGAESLSSEDMQRLCSMGIL